MITVLYNCFTYLLTYLLNYCNITSAVRLRLIVIKRALQSVFTIVATFIINGR